MKTSMKDANVRHHETIKPTEGILGFRLMTFKCSATLQIDSSLQI